MANTMSLILREEMYKILEGKDLWIMLLEGTSTTPDDPTHDFVTDIVADEHAVATRKQLANLTVERDDVNGRVEFHWDPVTWTALTGNATTFAVIFELVNDDTDSPIQFVHECAYTPTGVDLTVQPGSQGSVWSLAG